MTQIEKTIQEYAKEPKNPQKFRSCYPHAKSLSEPDIMYYHRNAVRYVNAKKAYDEANEKQDWSTRSNAVLVMSNVEKKFEELLCKKQYSL
mgnify:CR=1 FL=1